MKKHIPPLLLTVWPYLIALLCFIPEEGWESLVNWLSEFPGLIALLAANLFGYGQDFERIDATIEVIIHVIGVISFVCVLCVLLGTILYPLRTKSLTALELARWDFIIKLCHIPVFVVVFALCLMFMIAIAVPAILMAVIIMVPGMFFFDLTMMLTSSCYGFRAIKLAQQEGLVEKKWAVKHTILHCIFVLDVISAFRVWKRLRAAGPSACRADGTAPADNAG